MTALLHKTHYKITFWRLSKHVPKCSHDKKPVYVFEVCTFNMISAVSRFLRFIQSCYLELITNASIILISIISIKIYNDEKLVKILSR